ncbi:MAG TPA: phosphoserine phosphatase SerB [Kofleriaceae bacterium]|nr:phosphoserine phosphatase SerB [Kofleriaceae bacterium]
MSDSKRVLVTVHGPDRPGICHAICRVLAEHSVPVIDIEQSSTHRLLSLSFVIDLGGFGGQEADAILVKALLYEGWRLGAQVHLERMREDDFIAFPELSESINRNLCAITMIGNQVGADALAAVSEVLARRSANITNIHKLSRSRLAAVEIIASVPGTEEAMAEVKREILAAAKDLDIDIAIQRENLYRRSKRLVVFDMDSTLIEQEVIDEVARAVGCHAEVAAVTERAMRGEIEFRDAFAQRVALFRGARLDDILAKVAPTLTLKPGAAALIDVLKKLGYKLAVISGGFGAFVDPIKEQLGLDYAFSNTLDVEGGVLTGRVAGEVIDRQGKAELLSMVARREGIQLDQVMAVGDGANDLAMLERAGLGVAFNAKKNVQAKAQVAVNNTNMASLLYLLGIRDDELPEL